VDVSLGKPEIQVWSLSNKTGKVLILSFNLIHLTAFDVPLL